jgi:hypothetical protein
MQSHDLHHTKKSKKTTPKALPWLSKNSQLETFLFSTAPLVPLFENKNLF